ncbi:DUF7666 domain-containing protein [Tepidibacter hydrothermalis]|uniref:DUF7666 domain-containing protein n=1 Tax=Tepidibacter hydrothermalis TaxID=3036126 RepID=A0ABY8EK15_9FIRM|nr:hypothetical protein [Tepidibacter hydrothermalis]WFD12244.1 hypothetical protein P4S50_09205 [Tepidibacter hydrothermalis]
MEAIKGFKVFNPDWTCRGFQYEVGKTFEDDITPSVCDRGFHFCKEAKDCFNYYRFDPDNKVAEVVAIGEVAEEGDKCSTNKIQIVREIPWSELLNLVNLGKGNVGLRNSGNRNSGNRNSGDWNSGNRNSGNRNSGNRNSGNRNSGDWNSGNRNSGDWNSGNRNSGNRNSGNRNSGNRNSGDWNSGDWNSGNRNSGDWNSGDWNKSSFNAGCFNTEQHKLKFFDKETDMTMQEWWNSDARYLMNQIDFRPTEWIWSDDMTDEEKEQHPEYKTTDGYLKVRDNKNACIEWWNGLSEIRRNVIKEIPNFDADKFFEITGIRV